MSETEDRTGKTLVTCFEVRNEFAGTGLYSVKRCVWNRQTAVVASSALAVQMTKYVRGTTDAAVVLLHTPTRCNN